MDESIERPVYLNGLTHAKLIASRRGPVSYWALSVALSGPDGRYNWGTARLAPSEVRDLRDGLARARSEIARLKGMKIPGTYSKVIVHRPIALSVIDSAGRAGATVALMSSTGMSFSVPLGDAELGQWLTAIDIALEQGPELVV